MKELLKSANIWQSYSKNKSGPVFLTHSVVHNTTLNSSNNFPSYFQTDTIAQMLASGGEGAYFCIIIAWETVPAGHVTGIQYLFNLTEGQMLTRLGTALSSYH